MWKVVQCAVQGRGHIKENIPCQDKIHYYTDENTTITALADGAGSAKLSHIGAEQITHFICDDLLMNFENYYDNDDGVAVKSELDHKIKAFISNLAHKAECEERDLASTLLVVAVKDNRYILMHIGDGVIGYSKNGELKIASHPENGEFVNTTVFTTSSEAIMTMRIIKGKLGTIDSFILMSDGTEVSLYDKRKKTLADALSKIVMLQSYLPDDKIKEQLNSSFNSVIRNATTDDCSISIMTKCPDYNKGYLSLDDSEKAKILHIKTLDKKAIKRIHRFDAILIALKYPGTISKVSSVIHLKPKYTIKHISKLLTMNFIEKQSNMYKTIINT